MVRLTVALQAGHGGVPFGGVHDAAVALGVAVREGFPPPSDLPTGECILTSLRDDHGQPVGIRIERADPHILISAELLDTMAADPAPGVELLMRQTGHATYDHGDVLLKIHGTNRTVIYRITEYLPAVHGYIGEWPD